MPDDSELTEAYREVLRAHRAVVSAGKDPSSRWRGIVHEALTFLGGQADRHTFTLAKYPHRVYGPYVGISDDGGAAADIRLAAWATPKAVALAGRASPLSLGVGLDAERLGGVGEVPIGPDEFARIWSGCAGRTLMTTNVGSRVNLRFYHQPPIVTLAGGHNLSALNTAKTALADAFRPFLQAPGGPRPLVTFVEFQVGAPRSLAQKQGLLRSLRRYVRSGGIAARAIQHLGLFVEIGSGSTGCNAALRAIDLARACSVKYVSIHGVVRKDADSALSLPGLLDYFPGNQVTQVLKRAAANGVRVRSINQVDPDTVARGIWSALNSVRAMGFDLGKYGLFPLTLEECDAVIGLVQGWFEDWCAAPVFYVDQGILSQKELYAGSNVEAGMKEWLRIVAKHNVKVVLFDTVDKSKGWKILRVGNDPSGLLEPKQVVRVNAFGETLGIKVLWAGGITLDQAYEFGKIGVFGVYVTTAVSKAAPVTGVDRHDPALASKKRPTFDRILKFKTVLEGGFLAGRFASQSPRPGSERAKLLSMIEQARADPAALSRILPVAWRAWWRRNSARPRPAP
jgi:hypothetical protein